MPQNCTPKNQKKDQQLISVDNSKKPMVSKQAIKKVLEDKKRYSMHRSTATQHTAKCNSMEGVTMYLDQILKINSTHLRILQTSMAATTSIPATVSSTFLHDLSTIETQI